MDELIRKMTEAEKIYNKLKETRSMPEVADIIDNLNEEMARLVLKKFVYAQKED